MTEKFSFAKHLENEVNRLNEVRELKLTDELTVKYYKRFTNDKITELVVDLIKLIGETKNFEKPYPANDLDMRSFVNFLIIKHFTDFKAEISELNAEAHIAMLFEMAKTSWYADILNAFDAEDVEKVHESIKKISDALNKADEIANKKKGKK